MAAWEWLCRWIDAFRLTTIGHHCQGPTRSVSEGRVMKITDDDLTEEKATVSSTGGIESALNAGGTIGSRK